MSDFFYKLPSSRQHIIVLGFLFILPLILFYESTLGGEELRRHDITQYRAAVESVYDYQETYDRTAYWATNMYGGMPSYVIRIEKATYHLDSLIGKLKVIYPAGYYWVLLFGMYFLLQIMGFRTLSSGFGAVIFGLTSYFAIIVIAGHTSKFHALSFIPWMFAGYWLLVRKKKIIPGLALFTISLALEIRAGHPQITYYFFYLLGFLWLFDSWNMLKDKLTKQWMVVSVLLALATVVGVLGTAEKFLALQEYAQYSIRGGSDIKESSTMDLNYAFGWSQGVSETLTLIIPDFFGGASPTYWGLKPGTSGPHYLGAIGFVFFVIALFKVREKTLFVFLGTGILAILFAWGGNFLLFNKFAFEYIPYFDKFRAPETWLVLTIFCFSIIATYGIDWLQDYLKSKTPSIKGLYAPLIVLGVIFLSLFVYNSSRDFIRGGEVESIAAQIAQQNQIAPNNPQVLRQANNYVQSRLVPDREDSANRDTLRFAVFLVITIAVLYLMITSKLGIGLGSILIILLATIDLIQVDRRYLPEQNFVANNINTISYIESQKRDLDQFIIDNIYEDNVYPGRVFPLLDNPFGDATYSYFYPLLGGYTAAKLSTFQDVFIDPGNPLFAGPYGLNLELLAIMNTKYITYNQPLSIPGLTPAFQSQSGIVYELDEVLPKAFFVDTTITVGEPKEAFDLLFPGKIDLTRTAIVEGFEGTTSMDTTSTLEVTFYTGQEMTMEISRSTPGFLVISEMFYPEGWIALLNDEQVEIHRTNYLLRGIQIPEGDHTLTLEFRPNSVLLGYRLSWISFFVQVGLIVLLGYSYFKKTDAQE